MSPHSRFKKLVREMPSAVPRCPDLTLTLPCVYRIVSNLAKLEIDTHMKIELTEHPKHGTLPAAVCFEVGYAFALLRFMTALHLIAEEEAEEAEKEEEANEEITSHGER
jgi:hypothetical protein